MEVFVVIEADFLPRKARRCGDAKTPNSLFEPFSRSISSAPHKLFNSPQRSSDCDAYQERSSGPGRITIVSERQGVSVGNRPQSRRFLRIFLKMAQNDSLIEELLRWASRLGTYLHQDVHIYQDPATGLSLQATRDIPPDTRLVNCSYAVTLSYLNAVDAPGFPRHTNVPLPLPFLYALGPEDPNVIGYFFLMQQYLLGETSFWWPYIQLLPQPDKPSSIPALWPEEDQIYLDGTNAEPAIKKRTDIWNEEWRKGIDFLRNRFENWEEYTYTLYKWAAGIFGSRSFRPSLTIPEVLVPDHTEHIQKDKFSILLPVMDIGNHNGFNNVNWTPNPSTRSFDLSNRGAIPQNDQIFNFYGNKSNSELLVGYGFTLATSPELDRDVVNLKLKPGAEVMELRCSQRCHVVAKEPEEEVSYLLVVPDMVTIW